MPATEVTSDRITSAALVILEKEGAGAVSLRRVAKDAGITPMAIYYHFAGKDALLWCATERALEKLRDDLRAIRRGDTDRTRLLHAMEGYMDYAIAHPRMFDYFFSQERPNTKFPLYFQARVSPTIRLIVGIIKRTVFVRKLRHDDLWEIAMELWPLAHGYVALHRSGSFAVSEERFKQLYRRAMERSINALL